MDNNDVKIPECISLNKKSDSSLNIDVFCDDFRSKFHLQMTSGSLFQNKKEYLLVKMSKICFFTIVLLALIIVIIVCILEIPSNLKDVCIRFLSNLTGSSNIYSLLFSRDLGNYFMFGLFICWGLIAISSLKIPNTTFLQISNEGVNITSEEPERGSIFIEKRNIKDIVVKGFENKTGVVYNIILYCYNSICLPKTKILKKEIFLIPTIQGFGETLSTKTRFKNGVEYIKQEIKNALKI